MANAEKSFKELLDEAPQAGEVLTTLTGTLFRGATSEQFVLVLADGRAIALDVAAVKAHKAISGSAGRTIIRIEVDPKDLPSEILYGGGVLPALSSVFTLPSGLLDQQFPPTGYPGHPDVPKTVPEGTSAAADQSGSVPPPKHYMDVLPSGPGDTGPFLRDIISPGPYAYGVPFALATPHQSAAAAALAAQTLGGPAQPSFYGGYLTVPPYLDM